MKLDMPKVVLILGAFALVMVTACWLIATGRMPADGLVKVVTAVLALAAVIVGWAQTAYAAYLRGKGELPDYLTDPAKLRAARTVRPPPLPGHDPVPVVQDLEDPESPQ